MGKVCQILPSVAPGRALALEHKPPPGLAGFGFAPRVPAAAAISLCSFAFLLLMGTLLEFMITEEGKAKAIPERRRKRERLG